MLTRMDQAENRSTDIRTDRMSNQDLMHHMNPQIMALNTWTMKNLAAATLLPKPELIHFDGNPLRYFIFMKSFENKVEKDTKTLVEDCSYLFNPAQEKQRE